MPRRLLGIRYNRLQRKVVLIILVMVVVPMLLAGVVAASWVSSNFEERIGSWVRDASHVGETWLKAYQNDAVMIGAVLADDPEFIAAVDISSRIVVPPQVERILRDLGLTFVQIYNAKRELIFSSEPMQVRSLWEPGQSQAVLQVTHKNKALLATVGVTPMPRKGTPRYYLVLGGMIDKNFIEEVVALTGLKARLYYREGSGYYDLFTQPGKTRVLSDLPRPAMKRLQQERKPYYSIEAEGGQYRGQYTPIVDSEGRVEAILFTGIERRGFEELLTNRLTMFTAIAMLGVMIALMAGLFLSHLIVRPVEYLRDGVMRLAGRNFTASVPITSNDELGDLAKAFNAMAVRLREARDEEQQAYRRDKLAALGELSASLAHEIRNPIGVINTAAALLDKPGQDEAKRAELVRMIREEGTRVGGLVQDFLQLSRHKQPEFMAIDPVVPIERAVETAVAGHPEIKVIRDYRHEPRRVLADATLLQQACINIFTNAVQAMAARGGELRLSTREQEDELVITIEDTGPGIPAEIMPRLFEPFFTTKEGGTGLGLSIANTLVESNGARLEVLAPESGGARFAMRFPIYEETP
jgi:signal transduction histidine kinase